MRRGFSLAYVLTLAALAFLLVGLAINSSLQLHAREQHRRNREQAILYAKNALERAFAELAKPGWGKQPTDEVKVGALAGHPSDAGARITFDPADPDASVNHLDQDGTSEVPKNTAHLWSIGTYRGVKVRLEASVAKPLFPFAIASSGPISTSGAFFAGTVEDPADADLPIGSPEFLKKVKQASLLSNGSASLDGAPVHITGDLISAGEISRGPEVRVDGQVRAHSAVKPIPKFDLSSFDTAGKPLLDEIAPGNLHRATPIKGYARCDGNLRVSGPLQLEEAILYVNGDLRVDGQLSGKGALFVRGDVVVESTALGALDEVALISGGNLTVTGRARSKLVGLLVSCGDLSLSNVTVVGAVVCAGDSGRTLTMENVGVFGSAKGLQFEFEMGWGFTPEYSYDRALSEGGGRVTVQLVQVSDSSVPTGKRNALPSDFVGRYDDNNPEAPLLRETDFEVVLPDGSVNTMAAAGIPMETGPAFDGLIKALQEKTQAEVTPQPQGAFSQGKLSLDLNRFLRVGDTLQVVYRRIY